MASNQVQVQSKRSAITHSPGNFARKVVLISALALASPVLIAQVAPEYRDCSGADTTLTFRMNRSIYKRLGQPHTGLEYVAGVQTTLIKKPKEDMLLPEGVVLSIDEQKRLFHNLFLENDKYAFFYYETLAGFYANNLFVFKKKQSLPNSSDTLK